MEETKRKIKILLSQTTVLDYNSPVSQDKIYFNPVNVSHSLKLAGEYIYTKDGDGIIINIPQN